jgi:circadian clock protein KaiC
MRKEQSTSLPKTPTGIVGLDEITFGGLPKGRPTLICGSAGCGKTLFGIQFLERGITQYDEPGVLISFEESKKDIAANVQSLGINTEELIASNKLRVDYVRVDRAEIEETGEYDLEGLFIRIGHAIDSIGAKRLVLDTIESLFGGIENTAILRAEIRRLFQWIRDKGITAMVTGERGEKTLTRQGLEEYVSDCVILLDFRVVDQIATRRLRIVKYRGSTHGTNEYPFLIDDRGISVLPITSLRLEHTVSTEIISTGIPAIDKLFKKGGLLKGSSILLTGTAGTAKTIMAAFFAAASCQRGESTLFFSFEESADQLIRNIKSVGLELMPFVKSGKLVIHASRPSLQGLEMHLLRLHRLIEQHKPTTVVIDPISSLLNVGDMNDVSEMLVRLIDSLKLKGINAYFTSLTHSQDGVDKDLTVDAVSSLADVWMRLEHEMHNEYRLRGLRIIKVRGMGHETDLQNFKITNNGIQLVVPKKKVAKRKGSR